MNADEIATRIQEAYPGAKVATEGADCSFSVTVTSEAFAGLSLIQRQRPLLALFKDQLASGELHALSIVALAPQETPPSAADKP